MLTTHQEHLVSLLLGSFPNFQSGDAEAALAAYAMVITSADPRDVEPGIMLLINGQLPGLDGRFAPTAPQLARAIRVCLDKRVDAEIAARRRLPPPADDAPEPTPEQKAKVRAILDNLKLAEEHQADARAEERRALLRRTNERFDPQPLSYSTVNTADDDAHDMGGERVA